MSSKKQIEKCKVTVTLYKGIKGYRFTCLGKYQPSFFSVFTPWADSL